MTKKTDKPEPEIQCWDSCLFIELLANVDEAKVKQVLGVLKEATSGRARIVLSNFVLAEVRPKKGFKKGYKSAVTQLLETDVPYVDWVGVTRSIARRAAELGHKHDLSPADAVHIATAVQAGADVFFTFDGKRKEGRRKQHPLSLSGKIKRLDGKSTLLIDTPRIRKGPLFDKKP